MAVSIACNCKGVGLPSSHANDPPIVWPLRTEEEYLRAQAVVDRLAIKGEENLTEEERDRLDIFSMLMESYEEDHYNCDLPEMSSVDLLRRIIDLNGMNESDLGRLLGDPPPGHKILNGDRQLSKNHIKILSEHFEINARAFL